MYCTAPHCNTVHCDGCTCSNNVDWSLNPRSDKFNSYCVILYTRQTRSFTGKMMCTQKHKSDVFALMIHH